MLGAGLLLAAALAPAAPAGDRISGFLDFWVNGAYGGLDWSRYPDRFDTPEEFASWWHTYGQVQWTARQNAIIGPP
jgi:hypothetical protein